MARTKLDSALLEKMAAKLKKKDIQLVRQGIASRAARWNVSSEAAQILWAKELGIGTAFAQRRLDPFVQQQIASRATSTVAANGARVRSSGAANVRAPRQPSPLQATIDLLLSDEELKNRCADLLKARRSFDRVFREATVVLDDRLKRLGGIKGKVNLAEVVARTLHPQKGVLRLSPHDDEQQGLFDLVRGLVAAFRNPAHHSLNDRLTREDALRFCGFIDSLLALLGKATVVARPTS